MRPPVHCPATHVYVMPTQLLEARHAAGEPIYLDAERAVQLLQTGSREIGFLTYGWLTREHPDPGGSPHFAQPRQALPTGDSL